ncbi:interferon-stimulated 20 kDa exonuclease-like 2 [Astyanax mexicanus]|uniref:Interferon-stimulated 20 kDa exonuclease-like 2 n=1 Tax=Astyanax mexicanus TaxID=7994 RepID=A0A8B9R9X8_ASTMX|nr:interferon-stimulated 20 kDa exonuclease-like 2 [Astyanax mexicanus]
MSDIMLNLNMDGPRQGQRKPEGNSKHKRFVKKRHFLERKGLLNEKQNTNYHDKQRNWKKPWYGQRDKKDHSHSGAVFPKFVNSHHESSSHPSSSMQGHHNCASKHNKESSVPSSSTSRGESTSSVQRLTPELRNAHKYVAIDCEMVGTGPKGHCSELARCSIVTYDGDVIYDKFIQPVNPVTDFRTRWSGIRRQDLRDATPFKQAQRDILKILSGKVVVGHAIHNDLKVLHYSHPTRLIRDTSRIPILNQKAGLPKDSPASLKKLTKLLFNKDIQMGKKGHSSVEDAKATMELYRLVELEYERTLASKSGHKK